MSVVAGLDLSLTSAGVAILRDGEPKLIRSVGHGSADGKSYAHRSRRIVSQVQAVKRMIKMGALDVDGRSVLNDAYTRPAIDLAVIEGPLHHGPQQAYEWDRSQLWGGVFSQLLAWKIPTAVINPMTLKLWFTGAGNATKLRMLDTARARFQPAITTHDEADAIACATAGAWRLGDPIPWEPKDRQIECLEKVEWPQAVRV